MLELHRYLRSKMEVPEVRRQAGEGGYVCLEEKELETGARCFMFLG